MTSHCYLAVGLDIVFLILLDFKAPVANLEFLTKIHIGVGTTRVPHFKLIEGMKIYKYKGFKIAPDSTNEFKGTWETWLDYLFFCRTPTLKEAKEKINNWFAEAHTQTFERS